MADPRGIYVFDTQTGQPVEASFEDLANDFQSGEGRFTLPKELTVRRGEETGKIAGTDIISAIQEGWTPVDAGELDKQYYKDIYETVPGELPYGQMAAAAMGAGRVMPGGSALQRLAMTTLNKSQDSAADLSGLQAANPKTVLISEIASNLGVAGLGAASAALRGASAATGLSAGASAAGFGVVGEQAGVKLAQLAAKAASKALPAIESPFLKDAGRVAQSAIRLGTEGSYYAATDALNEALINDPNHVAQAMMASIGPGAIWNATLGLGLQGLAKGATKSMDAMSSLKERLGGDIAKMSAAELERESGRAFARGFEASEGELNKLGKRMGENHWGNFSEAVSKAEFSHDGSGPLFSKTERLTPAEALQKLDGFVEGHGKIIGGAREKGITHLLNTQGPEGANLAVSKLGRSLDDIQSSVTRTGFHDEMQREMSAVIEKYSDGRLSREIWTEAKDVIEGIEGRMLNARPEGASLTMNERDYLKKARDIINKHENEILQAALSPEEMKIFNKSREAYKRTVGVKNAAHTTMATLGEDIAGDSGKYLGRSLVYGLGGIAGSLATGNPAFAAIGLGSTWGAAKYGGQLGKSFSAGMNQSRAWKFRELADKAVVGAAVAKTQNTLSKSAWELVKDGGKAFKEKGLSRVIGASASGSVQGKTAEERAQNTRKTMERLMAGELPVKLENVLQGLSTTREGIAIAQQVSLAVERLSTGAQRKALTDIFTPFLDDGKIDPKEAQQINQVSFAIIYPMETMLAAVQGAATKNQIEALKEVYPDLLNTFKAYIVQAINMQRKELSPSIKRNLQLLFDEGNVQQYTNKNQDVYAGPAEGQATPGAGGGSKPSGLSNSAAQDIIIGTTRATPAGSGPKWSRP